LHGGALPKRPTLYAKAILETTAVRNTAVRNNGIASRAAEVSYEPVWGKFFFTIRWRGTTLSQGIPIHRAVEDKNFSLWRFE
jgi:hypothetical protein